MQQSQQPLYVTLSIALLAGCVSGITVIAFQRITTWDLLGLLANTGAKLGYSYLYLLLPIMAILIMIPLRARYHMYSRVGLAWLTSAFHFGNGMIPLPNLLYQMSFACLAIISGFAVGAVGPALYIGAAMASILGQKLQFRPPSLRLLCGCGAAAAMAALFNTPIAAVFLVTELIICRWHWRTLLPMAVAAFTAAQLTQLSGTTSLNINTHALHFSSDLLWILPLTGLTCALVAILLNQFITYLSGHPYHSHPLAWVTAAMITAVGGFYAIETMGLGESMLHQLFYMPPDLATNIDWLLLRILLTAVALGVTIPGGTLGPALVLGALIGGIFSFWLPTSHHEMILLASMGAMLGAILGAPIAAILLVSELTHQPQFILSACIVCGVASLSLRLLKQQSLHQMILTRCQINLENSPLLQANSEKH